MGFPSALEPLGAGVTIEREIVWLKNRRQYAYLVRRGAYFSDVEWTEDGIIYNDTVENDDYEFWEERAIDFDADAD